VGHYHPQYLLLLQNLLVELDKDKVNQMLEEMKMTNKDLEDQLDRSLELFKQLEFEQKLQETIEKLKNLSEKQDKLAEETKESDNSTSNEDLKQKQEELNKDFDKIRKDIECFFDNE
jgi:uncharacterized FlaG/YvyC family protein